MCGKIVHQELLTLGRCSLVRKGGISRKPDVIVCFEMGTLETRCQCSSSGRGPRARSSQDVDTMDHRLMPLWMSSPRQLCLEPTSHLGRILAIGIAKFLGEIRLFTGNDPIAEHQYCWHNQEQY